MIAIGCVSDIRQMLGDVKARGGEFATNFFLQDSAVEGTIRSGRLFAKEGDSAVHVLKRESEFDRLYYGAANPGRLGLALSRFDFSESAVVVVDVVGREGATAPWIGQFISMGFSRRAGFLRMQRMFTVQPFSRDTDSEVEVAHESDAEAIHEAIAAEFDAYSEHIPPVEEIRNAISLGTILLVRDAGRLAALLHYDRAGLTTVFRYWIVRPEYRHTGAGDKLIRRYFRDCADCRRSLLWVKDTNRRAIPIYRWYGFAPDSMTDVVLTKGL